MPQLLLFPDPCPLVERFGREFFRQLPECPGVYLLRDVETVLYVGKAKNLRKRLNSYRVANPDRVPRRHLRLLRSVNRIELQECPSEAAALTREAELLLSLNPKFNRVGTYRAPPRFLIWRIDSCGLDLRLAVEPETDFEAHGPMKGGSLYFHRALARLLWQAVHPQRSLFDLPAGWIQGRIGERVRIPFTASNENGLQQGVCNIRKLLAGEQESFFQWIQNQTRVIASPLELGLRDEDLKTIAQYFGKSAH
jgi:predicted GIY-YIG superfamily endonuclease